MKKLLFKFVKRYYQPNLGYVDELLKQWELQLVHFVVELILYGFIVWLVILSITSIIPISWIKLGPHTWHLLNIIQLGLLSWFLKKIHKTLGGKRK